MSDVVEPWPTDSGVRCQPGPPCQRAERLLDIAAQQPGADAENEQGLGVRSRQPVRASQIPPDCGRGGARTVHSRWASKVKAVSRQALSGPLVGTGTDLPRSRLALRPTRGPTRSADRRAVADPSGGMPDGRRSPAVGDLPDHVHRPRITPSPVPSRYTNGGCRNRHEPNVSAEPNSARPQDWSPLK